MDPMDYMEAAEQAIGILRKQKGGLLTVKSEKTINTMTIGWVTIGFVWRKPVLMVAVRRSRYTFGLMQTAPDFTVSVPTGDMKETIMFCGTKSGRDVDKFAECGLTPQDSKKVTTPIVRIPAIHFECKTVFKTAMDPADVSDDIQDFYPEKDYHTLYFGEILACYEIQ